MPLFTFVVITYNVERYISGCLQSLKAQTLQDFEVVVVNDASTDGTVSVIREEIAEDSRFHLIDKDVNEGAHLARRAGALASHGQYVIFVDGDDEINRNCLELLQPVMEKSDYDIVRFGRNVVPLNSDEPNIAFAYENEEMFNRGNGVLSHQEILTSIFSERPNRHTWSIIDCAFDGDFVRNGFQEMTSQPLGRMQDSYEMFVLCAHAETMRFLPDLRGLRYHLGVGISGKTAETVDRFDFLQESAKKDYDAVRSFAQAQNDLNVTECANWLKEEYVRIVGNEWITRLTPEDQNTAMAHILLNWPAEDVCSMLRDPLMARGKWLLQQDKIPDSNDEFYRWGKLMEEEVAPRLAADDRSDFVAYQQLADDVKRHVQDIQRNIQLQHEREERMRQEQVESRRRFKKGTALRRVVDTIMPEGSLQWDIVRLLQSRRNK